MKKKTIYDAPNNTKITLLYTSDKNAVIKTIPKVHGLKEGSLDNCIGRAFWEYKESKGQIFIFVEDKYSKEKQIGVLAHEALHATHYVHDFNETVLQNNTQELYAHYIEWIMSNFVPIILEHNNG